MKTKITAMCSAALAAAGLYWGIAKGIESEERARQREQDEVVAYNYSGAQGYDVRLAKDFAGVSGVIFGIGTLEGRTFKGPAIIAHDYDKDGSVDEYHCTQVMDENIMKMCSFDTSPKLLAMQSRDVLSRIERELLPYYGQKRKQ